MKSRKNTINRGGGHGYLVYGPVRTQKQLLKVAKFSKEYPADILDAVEGAEGQSGTFKRSRASRRVGILQGGTKRRSRKSRKGKKTKKGSGAHEGGKKKCPKHCRRKTRHTRKALKHRKN